RLSRTREYRAYTAFPTIPGEPYYASYTKASGWFNSNFHDVTNGFACFSYSNTTDLRPTNISEVLLSSNAYAQTYNGPGTTLGAGSFLGNPLTADCQSRYGVNDALDKSTITNDYFYYEHSPSSRLVGGISPVDNGNRDFYTDEFGIETGFKIPNINTWSSNTYNYYTQLTNGIVNSIAIPLGLPIFNASATAYLSRALFVQPYISTIDGSNLSATTNSARSVFVRSRWSTQTNIGYGGSEINKYIRCVLPAD
nr:hypothetical protein [Pseudobdellovibrionaceae bacterium]